MKRLAIAWTAEMPRSRTWDCKERDGDWRRRRLYWNRRVASIVYIHVELFRELTCFFPLFNFSCIEFLNDKRTLRQTLSRCKEINTRNVNFRRREPIASFDRLKTLFFVLFLFRFFYLTKVTPGAGYNFFLMDGDIFGAVFLVGYWRWGLKRILKISFRMNLVKSLMAVRQ